MGEETRIRVEPSGLPHQPAGDDQRLAEQELRQRLCFERLVAEVSTRFIHLDPDQLVRGFEHALRAVAEFTNTDRACVVLFDDTTETLRRIYDWRSDQTGPSPLAIEPAPICTIRYLTDPISRSVAVHIPRVADLPAEAIREREILESADVRSLLAIPLAFGERVLGFLSLESVRAEQSWSAELIASLRVVGQLFANAVEHRNAEETLLRERDLTAHIIATSPAGIAVFNRQQEIVYANDYAERLAGLSHLDLAGRSRHDLHWRVYDFDGHPIPEGQLSFQRIAATLEPVANARLLLELEDGQRKYVSLNAVPLLDADGAFDGVVVALLDLTSQVQAETERTRLEEQLRQAQKMEAIGQLAGGVAHDFRNQLTVIQGYCELILAKSLVAPEGRGMVEEVLRAASRSATLTGQLLAYSRKQVLQARVCDLRELVGEIAGSLPRLVGEDIEIRILTGTRPCTASIDPHQLQEAIFNLVTNARHAMPKGGQLTIETGRLIIDGAPPTNRFDLNPGEYVFVLVSDTGCGMNKATMERVFEPFYTTKGVGEGSGLGLSMVYGFAKQSGGAVEVASKLNVGSTFTLCFPLVAPPTEENHAAPQLENELASHGETILVVEDEEAVRQLLVSFLTSARYCVVEAANAKDAFTALVRPDASIDLVVSDVIMPGLDGLGLAAKVKVARPDLPVLMISGYGGHDLSRRGLVASADRFLTKPFSRNDVLTRVRKLLDGCDRNP